MEPELVVKNTLRIEIERGKAKELRKLLIVVRDYTGDWILGR